MLAGVLVEHAVKASPAGSSADVASLALSHTVSGAASLPELAGATLRAWRRMRIQMAIKFGAVATAIALLLTGVILPFKSSSHSGRVRGGAPTSIAADQSVQSVSGDTAASNGPVNVRSLVFRVVDAQTQRGIAGAEVHARYWHDWQVDPRDDLVTDRKAAEHGEEDDTLGIDHLGPQRHAYAFEATSAGAVARPKPQRISTGSRCSIGISVPPAIARSNVELGAAM